jgi:hypothetical protein
MPLFLPILQRNVIDLDQDRSDIDAFLLATGPVVDGNDKRRRDWCRSLRLSSRLLDQAPLPTRVSGGCVCLKLDQQGADGAPRPSSLRGPVSKTSRSVRRRCGGLALQNVVYPRHHLFAEEGHRPFDHVVGHRTEFEDYRKSHQVGCLTRQRIAFATVSGPPRITMSFAAISSKFIACSIGACRRQKSYLSGSFPPRVNCV